MAKTKKRVLKPKTITPAQLNIRQSQLLIIDVRGWLEYLIGHIPGARKMSRGRILKDVPKDRPLAVTCLSGTRSQPTAQWLAQQGYEKVYNLQGGCMAWQQAGHRLKRGTRP
jgi:rhodanese-related sulfurtransferase